VNTQTGQLSRDLPLDVDQDISEGELPPLIDSRCSELTVLAIISTDVATINGPRNGAGFGVPRRTSTPEPWKRVLADDGLSYYFVNTIDGAISLTMPSASTQQLPPATQDPGPSQTDASPVDANSHVSPTPQTGVASGNESDRYSAHSDDSDIHPSPTALAREMSSSSLRVPMRSATTQLSHSLSSDLTPAERSAQELQQALAAPPPDSVNQLAVVAREAIGNVVQYIQIHDNTPPGRYGNELNDRVLAVVYSVRNLLYASATPSSQITNNLYPRDTRHIRTTPPSQALQAHLKPAQRKVAGTLSKLVLSTLAVQYEANHSQAPDKPMRMEGDAGELDRAVVAFVTEVQRFLEQNAQSSDVNVIKRLHGVFEPEHVGLGLVGGGAAAGWKGFGWLALEGEDEAPNRQLSVEVITELKGLITGIDAKRVVLVDTKFDVFGGPGKLFSDNL
jgi:son of sevenless-like protein